MVWCDLIETGIDGCATIDGRVAAVGGLWHNGGPRVTVEQLEALAPPTDDDGREEQPLGEQDLISLLKSDLNATEIEEIP